MNGVPTVLLWPDCIVITVSSSPLLYVTLNNDPQTMGHKPNVGRGKLSVGCGIFPENCEECWNF